MIYLEIITSIIIFLVMGYMSAIGTAYLSVKEKELGIDQIKDKKKIKKLKFILNKSSTFVYSIKSGISFCSLWLGALIVEIFASPIYQQLKFTSPGTLYVLKYIIILLTVIVLSYFLYVFAEVIPKSIAIKKRNKIVLETIDIIYIIAKIFSPINKFLKTTDELIMRIFNFNGKDKISYKDSEVREEVEIVREQGSLSNQEGNIISNFLKLDEMTAKDIMKGIEEVTVLDINSSKKDIKEIIINSGYTRIPVCDGDKRNIIGIMNVKNILKDSFEKKYIKDCETKKYVKPCMYVSSGKRIDLLFHDMKKNKEHMAIIVKEKNIVIGVITMEDILEEIVGNIEDDFEKYAKMLDIETGWK